jgi:mRNA interferase HigB
VRIITRRPLVDFGRRYPNAVGPLDSWFKAVKSFDWESISEVRESYPHADSVVVDSGRTATVFNIGGNKFRLVTAIHYNRKMVFVLRLLTHKEYDSDKWKREL